jgi:N-acetylneuraminic acid mutarotase
MLKSKVIPLFVIILLFILSFAPVNAKTTELSEWKNTMQYPQSISSHQSVSYQGNIYVFGGGYNDTYTKDIFRAEISNNGEINNWVKAGELPTPLIWHSIVRKENYIFLIGGAVSSGSSVTTTNKVYIATINGDKNISNWKEITSLPVKLGRGNAVIFNDNLYYLGGVTKNLPNQNEVVNSAVFSAQINFGDQTINSWTARAGLPQTLAEFAIFQNQNIIFVAGGMRANSQPSNETYRGEINQNGDLSWSISQNIPETGQGTQEFMYTNPSTIEQYLINDVVQELIGTGSSPSTGLTAARTNWVMDQVLKQRINF